MVADQGHQIHCQVFTSSFRDISGTQNEVGVKTLLENRDVLLLAMLRLKVCGITCMQFFL